MAARAFLLLQSTIATSVGMALLAAPKLFPGWSTLLFVSPLKKGPAELFDLFGFVAGAFSIFIGAALCTAAGSVNAHIAKSVGTGYLVIAAAFGYLHLHQGSLGTAAGGPAAPTLSLKNEATMIALGE